MSNAAKLKKKAVELEQKKQFDKALALYIQFLQESDTGIDDVDVPLYNRVGDLLLRTGNASDALNYYEKAVDLYADRGFLNNAIALCNKVLRQSPGRASIYYKLGKISATKGFKSDAKKNFLEYADRMQQAGQIDEAFRALKEFADLCPDQDDIRLMLAEQLTKENRQNEALEQLQKLHDKLDSEGRSAEARATVDRMKSIDPEAVPRVSGSYRPQKTHDLIFLDTSFEQPATRTRQSDPVPAPAGRQVSDPDLVVLTLADAPDAPVSPVHNAAIAESFDLEVDSPASDAAALPLLDVDVPADSAGEPVDLDVLTPTEPDALSVSAESPVSIDLDVVANDEFSIPAAEEVSPDAVTAIDSLTLAIEQEPTPVDLVGEQPSYVSGPPLGIDYASDLAADVNLPPASDDLFDFRAPPRSDDAPESTTFGSGLDPDVAFPSFDLDDTSLPSADEITSGASLTAALAPDLTTPDALLSADAFSIDGESADSLSVEAVSVDAAVGDAVSPDALATDLTLGAPVAVGGIDLIGGAESLADGLDVTAVDAPTNDGSAASLELDWPATEPDEATTAGAAAADLDGLDVVEESKAPLEASGPWDEPEAADIAGDATIDDEALSIVGGETADELAVPSPAHTVDSLQPGETAGADVVADAPVEASVVTDSRAEPELPELPTSANTDASRAATDGVAEARDADATPEPEADATPRWETQRSHAERLLEAGDRAGGVRELEEVAAELERLGDLERALAIVDELIRLLPHSVRHHQKRVELAFRSNHRVKLIDAYLELGDALFRSGEERKARAVYQRVLELAPEDPRAKAAVDSVASVSMPTASGSMPAIPATPAGASPAPLRPSAPPRAPERHVAYQSTAPNGARPSAGAAAPPAARKPSPLDPSAASSDFVDLGEWLRSGDSPKSTRMVAEEKPPTGDEQADFQEMLKRFKQGVAENVEEEDYESHYDLGVAYKEMGLIDEAVAEFQKALRGTSHRVRTYEALGQCFVEKEQFQVAASVLTRALSLGEADDHQLVGVLYLLARATEALNKPSAALDYYQRVFAVDIEFRDVADRISAIEGKAT